MPQKPQVRAKEKRRLTKRLAAWRAKQDGAGPTAKPAQPKAKPPAPAAKAPAVKAPAPKAPAAKAPPKGA